MRNCYRVCYIESIEIWMQIHIRQFIGDIRGNSWYIKEYLFYIDRKNEKYYQGIKGSSLKYKMVGLA